MTYQIRAADGPKSLFKSLFFSKTSTLNVIKGISLQFGQGGITSIVGRNGCGKTTLIKLMTGILHPTRGSMTVFGHTPHLRKKDFLRSIGAIFANKKTPWQDLTVLETFKLTAVTYGVPSSLLKTRVEELVSMLNLESFVNREHKRLSLGESMKADIANAMIYKPKLLFLDEPTVGLDLVSQVQVREAIRRLCHLSDSKIILTSHNLRDISELSDEVFYMDQGQLHRFDGDTTNRALMEKSLEERILR